MCLILSNQAHLVINSDLDFAKLNLVKNNEKIFISTNLIVWRVDKLYWKTNYFNFKNFSHSKLLFFAEEEPESFDMCSPDGVKTSRFGKKCREDHMCDFHNQKYTWCYINFLDGPADWDYCSQCVDFRREGQNGQNQQARAWWGRRWGPILRMDK